MANNVSANALFHFTPEFKYLISILENGFYPRYCMEDLSCYIKNDEIKSSALPMICFCDIPLTQVDTHIKHYGEYAIGLKKEWGINIRGITPISYTHETSMLFNYISYIYPDIRYLGTMTKKVNKNKNNPIDRIKQNLNNMFLYLKPYEGCKWDKENKDFDKSEKIIFYNEREWRYVPDFVLEDNLPIFLPKEAYYNSSQLDDYNKRLESKKLDFIPSDIKYIIVPTDEDIPKMVDKVEDIMKQKYALKDNDIKLLITKITSMQQIRNDF